ncbi:hypothetical protein SeMB42_g05128 [Synchytrium endobioticum]|uniref:Uncharacterized protein n=1 Tax=Synchytrium endobioticum TaxID=286115 RepID=A0A507CK69_9FUNG|nr:hypothetical protein SeLEV6574_g06804 [Synchytrium endobioticum]TPX42418.1 hypothetical protein SeMB42_g05128 [Synchytrium endobioticum]
MNDILMIWGELRNQKSNYGHKWLFWIYISAQPNGGPKAISVHVEPFKYKNCFNSVLWARSADNAWPKNATWHHQL